MPDDLPERLEIRVIPRAKRNEIGGERAGRLLVRTTAAPVDGKADKSVIRQVAEHLGIRPGCIEIATGHSCRDKTLRPNWWRCGGPRRSVSAWRRCSSTTAEPSRR